VLGAKEAACAHHVKAPGAPGSIQLPNHHCADAAKALAGVTDAAERGASSMSLASTCIILYGFQPPLLALR
jgi:hypothetical protein